MLPLRTRENPFILRPNGATEQPYYPQTGKLFIDNVYTMYNSTTAAGISTKELIYKGLVAGGLGMGLGMIWYGMSFSRDFSVFGMNIPQPLVIGMATAGGQVFEDLVHVYLIPVSPNRDSFFARGGSGEMAVGVAIAGVGTVAMLKLMGAEGGYKWGAFWLGGVSNLGTELINSYIINKVAFP